MTPMSADGHRSEGADTAEIAKALQREQFFLVFQPKITLPDFKVAGFEGLIRWDHPTLGTLSPGTFMDKIKAANLIYEFDTSAIQQAAAAHAHWQEAGYDLPVSANVEAAHLLESDFLQNLSSIKNNYGLKPGGVVLEIAESALIQLGYEEIARDRLCEIHDLGFGLALEAAGMPALPIESEPCPFTELKIGTAAVLRLATLLAGTTLQGLFQRIDWAHDHGLLTVAVGVQDTQTLYTARDMGIMAAQGHSLAGVMQLREADKWLATAAFTGLKIAGEDKNGEPFQAITAHSNREPAGRHGRGLLSALPAHFRRLFAR